MTDGALKVRIEVVGDDSLREQLAIVTLERDQLRARLAAVTAEVDRIAAKYRAHLPSDEEFARRFPFQLLQESSAATESETQRG